MKQKLWLTLITCLAYCIDKELYQAIDYLREQVRVLVEHQEKQDKRIRLTNSQRMRVAAKAKRLSRKMLEQCTELFTPDTIKRWYRKLIAEKYDGSQNRTYAGRPQILQEIPAACGLTPELSSSPFHTSLCTSFSSVSISAMGLRCFCDESAMNMKRKKRL